MSWIVYEEIQQITISANVTSIVSINSNDKKVRDKMDSYTLHTFLLVAILLLMITNIYYHYRKYRSKQKDFGILPILK